MGAQFFFDEVVTSNDNAGNRSKCTVEVVDNHLIPEVRIGPVGELTGAPSPSLRIGINSRVLSMPSAVFKIDSNVPTKTNITFQ